MVKSGQEKYFETIFTHFIKWKIFAPNHKFSKKNSPHEGISKQIFLDHFRPKMEFSE